MEILFQFCWQSVCLVSSYQPFPMFSHLPSLHPNLRQPWAHYEVDVPGESRLCSVSIIWKPLSG